MPLAETAERLGATLPEKYFRGGAARVLTECWPKLDGAHKNSAYELFNDGLALWRVSKLGPQETQDSTTTTTQVSDLPQEHHDDPLGSRPAVWHVALTNEPVQLSNSSRKLSVSDSLGREECA